MCVMVSPSQGLIWMKSGKNQGVVDWKNYGVDRLHKLLFRVLGKNTLLGFLQMLCDSLHCFFFFNWKKFIIED